MNYGATAISLIHQYARKGFSYLHLILFNPVSKYVTRYFHGFTSLKEFALVPKMCLLEVKNQIFKKLLLIYFHCNNRARLIRIRTSYSNGNMLCYIYKNALDFECMERI